MTTLPSLPTVILTMRDHENSSLGVGLRWIVYRVATMEMLFDLVSPCGKELALHEIIGRTLRRLRGMFHVPECVKT